MPTPTPSPTYLLDAVTSQQWQLSVTEDKRPLLTSVTGQVAVAAVLLNSVTDNLSYSVSVVSVGGAESIRVQQVAQGVYPTQLAVTAPSGIVYVLQLATVVPPLLGLPAQGQLEVALPGSPAYAPLNNSGWQVLHLDAPRNNVGAQSSMIIPVTPGDNITFTATIRWLSGQARPVIGVWFYDSTLTVGYGAVQISPPITDNGWHIGTFTVTAPGGRGKLPIGGSPSGGGPATGPGSGSGPMLPIGDPGAAVMVVRTIAEGLLAGGGYFVGYVPTDSGGPFIDGGTGGAATGPAMPNAPVSWEVSDYRLTQNGRALYAPLDSYAVPYTFLREFVFPLYYLSLLTSEYQSAPNLYAWLATLIGPATDLLACVLQEYQNFDLSLATGKQLDTLGQIVGASRTLPFQPGTGGVNAILTRTIIGGGTNRTVFVNNTINMIVGLAVTIEPGTLNQETTSIISVNPGVSFVAFILNDHFGGVAVTAPGISLNPVLDDPTYTLLLQAKIAQNQWNGSIGSLYALWNQLFPGGRLIFIDNQNMTATIILAGVFSAIMQGMIVNGLIVPRPEAVLYNYTFATLPVLGFDLNNAVVAGFDQGHFI